MKLEKKIAELKAKNTEFRINQADQYQRMFKPYTDPDDIYEEFEQLLAQEIQTAVQKERTEVLKQIKDIMIDERFLNRQVIPPYGGTKHDSRERGEFVATERFMLQLKTLINSLTTKDTKERESILKQWADIEPDKKLAHVCFRLEGTEPVLTVQRDMTHQECLICKSVTTK